MSIIADKKERTPIWLIVLAIFILLFVVKFFSNNSETEKKEEIPVTYIECDINTMKKEIDENALSASEKYKGKYIEFVGKVNNIDSDGKYISVAPLDAKNYSLFSIHCSIKNESQKKIIMQVKKDDKIKIKGKVNSVGEIIGYTVDIKEIITE